MSLAYAATQRTRAIPSGFDERQAAAHTAMIEHLRAATCRPHPDELVRVAVRAVGAWHQSHAGCDRNAAVDRTAPAQLAYWLAPGTDTSEQLLVDLIALGQTWTMLTAEQQAVLTAVAEHRYVTRAAAALGISPAEAALRLQRAQDRFARLWEQAEPQGRRSVHRPRRGNTGCAGRIDLPLTSVACQRRR
jgi:hypothetical protein